MTPAWLVFIAVGMWASLQAPHWSACSLAGRALSDVIGPQAVVAPNYSSSVRASSGQPIDRSGTPDPMIVAADSALAAAVHTVLPSVSTTCLPATRKKSVVAQPRGPPTDLVTNPAQG